MNERRIFMYVGSMGNRENRGCGEGVTAFRFDQNTGAFHFVNRIAVDEPSVLAAGADGRFLYSTNEMAKFIDALPGTGGGVTAMAIDRQDGSVSLLNQQPALGSIPAYICVDNTGRFVCEAVHGSMSAGARYERNDAGEYECRPVYDPSGISLFKIREDGSLTSGRDLYLFGGEGHAKLCFDHPELADHGMPGKSLLNPRLLQLRPTIHSVSFAPNGIGVVCDRGADRIFLVKIDPEKERFVLCGTYEAKIGVAPRHPAFHPELPVLYVTNEIESSVTVLRFDEEKCQLTELQTLRTIAEDAQFKNAPADIRIHPSGKFLYASNRGDNSIVVYAIDKENGMLTISQIYPLGEPSPRWIGISPNGRYLVVSNSDANRVVSLRIDPDNGTLSPSGCSADVKSPSCLAFVQFE